MTRPEIRFYQQAKPEYIEERCTVRELSNTEQDGEVSIAEARVSPGVTTRWHQLNGTTERYVILAGKGCVEVGDLEATSVEQGDVVVIPADTRQRITNVGDTELVFLAICSPRFSFSVYQDLETDQRESDFK